MDAFYSYAISLIYRPFPTPQLIAMIQVLFLLLGVVFPPSHQSTCDSTTIDHTLIVRDTGNDTAECLRGTVPCHTLEYVLQYDQLSDNTMVSLNYSTKNIHVSEPIHIHRKSGLVILGDFPDQQVLLCDFGAGIAFEDVENVCIEKNKAEETLGKVSLTLGLKAVVL